jgi:hypothetical protein
MHLALVTDDCPVGVWLVCWCLGVHVMTVLHCARLSRAACKWCELVPMQLLALACKHELYSLLQGHDLVCRVQLCICFLLLLLLTYPCCTCAPGAAYGPR